jgi:hypothetical protein
VNSAAASHGSLSRRSAGELRGDSRKIPFAYSTCDRYSQLERSAARRGMGGFL